MPRTRARPRLAKTDGFRISSNLDARARLTCTAAGNNTARATTADAINVIATERATQKRRQEGVSACKRNEARTTPTVTAAADADPEEADEESVAASDLCRRCLLECDTKNRQAQIFRTETNKLVCYEIKQVVIQ